jgi:hypothetical protein
MKFKKVLTHYSDESGRFNIWPLTGTGKKSYSIEVDGDFIQSTASSLKLARDLCKKIKANNPVQFGN